MAQLNYVAATIIAFVVAACSRTGTLDLIDLASVPTRSVVSEEILLPEDILNPVKVFVLGENLAIFDDCTDARIIKIIDKQGLLLDSFGLIGNANTEYLMPDVFQGLDGSIILVSLTGKYTVLSYKGGELVAEDYQITGPEGEGVNAIAMTSDRRILFNSASSFSRINIQTADNGKEEFNFYPLCHNVDVGDYYKKSVLYPSILSASQHGTDFMLFGTTFPTIELIDSTYKEKAAFLLDVEEGNHFTYLQGIPHCDDPIIFYTTAASSNEYFFALYHGRRSNDIFHGHSEIHMFNLEGQLIKRIMPDLLVYSFAVSPSGREIYALGIDAEYNQHLYRYDKP